mmetsp:Transcript_18079/g.36393  ORF Transcript_18079/g.36393 Transcript_18079/m.36393 type:complete len:374 (-) Transcript_18079:1035-2156(-)
MTVIRAVTDHVPVAAIVIVLRDSNLILLAAPAATTLLHPLTLPPMPRSRRNVVGRSPPTGQPTRSLSRRGHAMPVRRGGARGEGMAGGAGHFRDGFAPHGAPLAEGGGYGGGVGSLLWVLLLLVVVMSLCGVVRLRLLLLTKRLSAMPIGKRRIPPLIVLLPHLLLHLHLLHLHLLLWMLRIGRLLKLLQGQLALHVELLQEALIAEGVMEGYSLRMEEAQGIVGGRGADVDARVDVDFPVDVPVGFVAADVGAVPVGVGRAIASVAVAAAMVPFAISVNVVSLRIFGATAALFLARGLRLGRPLDGAALSFGVGGFFPRRRRRRIRHGLFVSVAPRFLRRKRSLVRIVARKSRRDRRKSRYVDGTATFRRRG